MIAEPAWATIRREVAERNAEREAARQAASDQRATLAALDDETLLEELKTGFDEKAHFDELFRRFAPDMQAALFDRFDTQTAWDAFGKTWLRVKRSRGQAIPGDQLRPGLFSLAFNYATQIQSQL
jgi:hypothetical protein